MSSSSEILKKLSKDYGPSVATLGAVEYADTPRLPTGVFPFDLSLGGGFPMGRLSLIWGLESSGKTNLVLLAIAQGQALYPDKKAVFVDAEHAYDPKWALSLGVDVEKLIVVHPDYAEQAVDMLEAFLYATDVFCVVLDSIAALTTQNEIESGAEKQIVGGASLLLGKLFKKTTVSFNRMRNQGLMPPAFLAINQVRYKIGVMFGNPESMPGGQAMRHTSSCTVKLYGKNVVDKKIHPAMPAFKDISAVIQKWKMPILATHCEFQMLMLGNDGHSPGWVQDWNTLSSYLKELDYLGKKQGGGWIMFGEPFKTLEECRESLYADPANLIEVKATVIRELLDRGTSSNQEAAGSDNE